MAKSHSPKKAEQTTLEWRAVEDVIPYARNPRLIPDSAIGKVAASIKEFGFKQPIVVDREGVIVVGHTRLAAAQRLGMESVPVLVASDLSPAQVKAYRLADNRTGQEATWDYELLGIELEDLAGLDVDLSLTGFDADELVLKDEAGPIVEDEAPEPPDEPITQPGDLWLLGEHRVLCGDATKAEDVARLMGGATPALMVTDPPYGIGVDHTWRDAAEANCLAPARSGTVANDDRADWGDAYVLSGADVAYVWHSSLHCGEVFDSIERSGYEVRQQIIWVKNIHALSRSAYHWKHEPCWYAVAKGKAANWLAGRDQTTVWEAASPIMAFGGGQDDARTPHPTQKPVVLFTRPIENHVPIGGTVYDPFLGSGTTLIAAEQTGRICYGMEIDPRYCDVIVRRWEAHTGREATLAGGSATFALIGAERGFCSDAS